MNLMAEGPGFEPGLQESKSRVLPLDDPSIINLLFLYETFEFQIINDQLHKSVQNQIF